MPAAQEPTAQRPAHGLRELGESDTTDLQAVVDDGKLRHRRMCNPRVAHKITRLLFAQSRFDPRPRYPRRIVQPACPYGIQIWPHIPIFWLTTTLWARPIIWWCRQPQRIALNNG